MTLVAASVILLGTSYLTGWTRHNMVLLFILLLMGVGFLLYIFALKAQSKY